MPCYEVRTVSLELGTVDLDMLEEALGSIGYNVARTGQRLTFTRNRRQAEYMDGDLFIPADQKIDVNEIKRAYAVKAVQSAAKRFGWQMRGTKQRKRNQFQLARR